MLNGDGLRVVLWLSGCTHNCYKCQNPQTHNPSSGILFDEKAEEELFSELGKEYISGLTLTGGDPLHENNLDEVLNLVNKIRLLLPTKTIWLYSGYKFTDFFDVPIWRASEIKNNIKRKEIISMCDVMVDGKYIDKLRDVSLHWRGSSNQRVIDVKQTLQKGGIVLWAT